MSQPLTQNRIEPIVDPGPASAPPSIEELRAVVSPPPPEPPALPAHEPEPAHRPASTLIEVLARLEDKTARIEEKLSRSESFTARVIDRFEASSHRMSEVAQQSELAAVRSETKFIARRVRNLPGFSVVILSSVITAVLTALLTVLIIRFMPGLIGR